MKAQTSSFAKSRSKDLRRGATDCERLLWQRLRRAQLGAKFRRQHPFESYIVDFVCLEHRVVVELDGSQHDDAVADDDLRTKLLNAAGFRVLRFWNNEVLDEMDAVLEVIHRALQVSDRAEPIPSLTLPLKGRERKAK